MSLKLITRESQLPTGVITPELPVVFDSKTKLYHPLQPGIAFKKNKDFTPTISIINLDRDSRVAKFYSILTGIDSSVNGNKHTTFTFIKNLNNGSHPNNFYLGQGCSNFIDLYDPTFIWRRLRELHENGVKYLISEFNTQDRKTVRRLTGVIGLHKDLTDYICLVFGIKGGIKAVVKVVGQTNSIVELETLGLGVSSKNTKGFLVPIHHISKQEINQE